MESEKLEKIVFVVGLFALGGAMTNAGPGAQPIPYVIALLMLAPYTRRYYESTTQSEDTAPDTAAEK